MTSQRSRRLRMHPYHLDSFVPVKVEIWCCPDRRLLHHLRRLNLQGYLCSSVGTLVTYTTGRSSRDEWKSDRAPPRIHGLSNVQVAQLNWFRTTCRSHMEGKRIKGLFFNILVNGVIDLLIKRMNRSFCYHHHRHHYFQSRRMPALFGRILT